MDGASMDRPGPAVKARSYDASRRQAAAAHTHARVLQVAEGLFLTDGYAATSLGAIATAAGVSPELIYKTFGGKAGLVREIQRRGLLGSGPVSAPERSDAASASKIDARTLLREWAHLSTEVAPRVTPIMLLVRAAAATDADLTELQHQMSAQRLERMTRNAQRLTAHAGVRRDLSIDQIRDVLWTYSSPELYELLVNNRGWALDDYREFLFRGLAGQLLQGGSSQSATVDGSAPRARPDDDEATRT
jgi:AcrR family transcriptional regulator